MTVFSRAEAESIIQALTGGQTPEHGQSLVWEDDVGWTFGRAPNYAGIEVDANAVVTTIPLVNSWVLVTVFTKNNVSRTSTPDYLTNSLLIGATGDYDVGFNADISAAAAAKTGEINVFEISSGEKVITGATAADPVVITSAAHGFRNEDRVKISGNAVGGMVELNDRIFTVADKTQNTFELTDDGGASPANDIDGSGFAAWTSGGIVQLATKLDTHSHREYDSGGDIGSTGDDDFIHLTLNNRLQLAMKNDTDSNNFTIEHAGLRLERVD